MGKSIISLFALGCLLVASNQDTRASFIQAKELTGLTVSGTKILASGKPIMLRGVAVGDPLLARADRPDSDYERIAKEWHANTIRVGIHPTLWKHSVRDRVLAKLKQNVNAALRNGMYVIIDWHVIGWPGGYYQKPDAAWDEDPADLYDSNFELAKDFWTEMARQFGSDQRVVFELWNEPVYSKDDGDPSPTARWNLLKPKWAELQSVIRKYAKNIILVTGNEWAYNLRGIKADPLKGPNIAYSWHIYAGQDENDQDAWAESLDELQKVAPVVVCEWGFQRHTTEHFKGTPETFGKKFVKNFLDGRGLHSIAWCWHPDWTPAMLKNDWKTPTEMGAFVKDYLSHHQSAPGISF